MLQEALLSHGCTKSEAAAAEHLFKSLAFKPSNSDSPYCELPSAAQKGRTSATAPGSSPRDTVPATSSDADAAAAAVNKDATAGYVTASKDASAASAAASKDTGGASARAGATNGAKGAAASMAGPKDAIIDYAMFEQLWMADLTNPTSKAL